MFTECGLSPSNQNGLYVTCFSEFHSKMTASLSINQSGVGCRPAGRPCVRFLKLVAASEGLVSGYKLAEYDRFGAAVEEEKCLLMYDQLTSRPPHSL